jgi:alpha-tubulin suppressor-like RCC1 family protein
VPVPDLTDVIAVAAGRDHSLGLRGDGTVWAWGDNRQGQLGDGMGGSRPRPQPVPGLPPIVGVSAGDFHSLAVDRDGAVWAWGLNNAGQVLGIEPRDATRTIAPTRVPDLPNVIAVAAGFNFGVALTADGEVWAWGGDGQGALAPRGEGEEARATRRPLPVAGLPRIVAIAVGSHHALAVDEAGQVWAWGANFAGQLGQAERANSRRPLPVPALSRVRTVAGGDRFSVALTQEGQVWTWGTHGLRSNAGANAGANAGPGRDEVPIVVPLPLAATAIAAGPFACLIVLEDGTIWGWSEPIAEADTHTIQEGRLPPMPVPVNGLTDLHALAVGPRHALAVQHRAPVPPGELPRAR